MQSQRLVTVHFDGFIMILQSRYCLWSIALYLILIKLRKLHNFINYFSQGLLIIHKNNKLLSIIYYLLKI